MVQSSGSFAGGRDLGERQRHRSSTAGLLRHTSDRSTCLRGIPVNSTSPRPMNSLRLALTGVCCVAASCVSSNYDRAMSDIDMVKMKVWAEAPAARAAGVAVRPSYDAAKDAINALIGSLIADLDAGVPPRQPKTTQLL